MTGSSRALREGLAEIGANVAYVLKEAPGLELDESLRADIVSAFRELDGALHDIRSEVSELGERLAGESEGDPRVTLDLIRRWTKEQFLLLDPLVRRLKGRGAAFVLVAESAANILNAWAGMSEALAELEGKLEVRFPRAT